MDWSPNPVPIAVDLDHRQNKAQIDGHWLFLKPAIRSAHLVYSRCAALNGSLILPHVLAQPCIRAADSIHSGNHCLLGERSHGQQFVFECGELLLKMDAPARNPLVQKLCIMDRDSLKKNTKISRPGFPLPDLAKPLLGFARRLR